MSSSLTTAAADITEQFNYIHFVNRQPLNAERWLNGVYEAIAGLEDVAGYGRAPESEFLGVDFRQRIFKSHRIIYTFDELNRLVTVHYVRHSARRGVGESHRDK